LLEVTEERNGPSALRDDDDDDDDECQITTVGKVEAVELIRWE